MSDRAIVMLALIGAITLGFIVAQLRGCAEGDNQRWIEFYKARDRKAASEGKR